MLPAVPPVSPIVSLVNHKVGDLQVISLPGALVIGQVSPFDQIVINPFLIETDENN